MTPLLLLDVVPLVVVRGSAAGVEGWAAQRLPFDPKGVLLAEALRESRGRP